MCQGRPANPTDPGDAADLSIMGYNSGEPQKASFRPHPSTSRQTFTHRRTEINTFLTTNYDKRLVELSVVF